MQINLPKYFALSDLGSDFRLTDRLPPPQKKTQFNDDFQ